MAPGRNRSSKRPLDPPYTVGSSTSDTLPIPTNTIQAVNRILSGGAPVAHTTTVCTAPTSTEGTSGSSASSSSIKKGRGQAIGKELDNATKGNNKVPLKWNSGRTKPVGTWAPKLPREITALIRQHASPLATSWKKISEEERELIRNSLEKKFQLDWNNIDVYDGVNNMLRDSHKRFRHALRNQYLSFPEVEAVRHVPDDVSKDDWETLCARFSSPEFKMRSEKCALSRSNLRVNHVADTKSFVQLLVEKRDPETQEEPGRVDFYEITYRRQKTGEYSCRRAEELHTEMKALLVEPIVETSIDGEIST